MLEALGHHALASIATTFVQGVKGLLLGRAQGGVEALGGVGAALEGLLVLGQTGGLAVEALGRGLVLQGFTVDALAADLRFAAFEEGLQGRLLIGPQLQNVDVNAILTDLAKKKGGASNWQTSIVDTLKLLDLDSSLAERKDWRAVR